MYIHTYTYICICIYTNIYRVKVSEKSADNVQFLVNEIYQKSTDKYKDTEFVENINKYENENENENKKKKNDDFLKGNDVVSAYAYI
jgi:hypothetical protein